MYSNNILNFQESTTTLNAYTKKSGNLLNTLLILAQYLFILCLDFILQMSIDLIKVHFEKGKKQTIPSCRKYDRRRLPNTKAKSLLHSLEQAAGDIGRYVNANKTVHVFQTKKHHLHSKWCDSRTNGLVYIPHQ